MKNQIEKLLKTSIFVLAIGLCIFFVCACFIKALIIINILLKLELSTDFLIFVAIFTTALLSLITLAATT
jgi:uncharacterized membrane protein